MSGRAAAAVLEVGMDEVEKILAGIRARGAPERDCEVMEAIVANWRFLTEQLKDKKTSLERLRRMLFGAKTEKTEQVTGKTKDAAPAVAGGPAKPAEKRKGHGRIAAEDYRGAQRIPVAHDALESGADCPRCKGKVYLQNEPATVVRITGCAPVSATVFERERLRCNLCGEVFTAKGPEGVGEEKFDATATAMVAVLRYGSGFPFNRIEDLTGSMGIPFPASTQWELVRDAAKASLKAVYEELRRLAAQGELLHNDDTTARILEFVVEERKRKERGEPPSERTGTFTSGIVSVTGTKKIALYFTGRRHAGENLHDLLLDRPADLPAPLQMCDGLDRNLPGELKTIVGNCLAHGRRGFVEVAESFPEEVGHVLTEIALVYENEARAKAASLSPAARLALHKTESGPVMERLKAWLSALVEEKKVEPNSGLGEAIAYVLKRWEKLTLFLREEGAPLDNNICERVLKRSILHRKNSLFYKTMNGARVGDICMSLIATAKLSEVDPFHYLTELCRRAREVAAAPADWLPWNYRETIGRAPPST